MRLSFVVDESNEMSLKKFVNDFGWKKILNLMKIAEFMFLIAGEIISKRFYEECITSPDTTSELSGASYPVLVVAADDGGLPDAQVYWKLLQNKNRSKFLHIPGADHVFSGEKFRKALFEKTLAFIKNV